MILHNSSVKKHGVKAVILTGGRDFGRCSVASRLPRALWPLADKPVLQRLVEHISSQGISRIAICCDSDADLLRDRLSAAGDAQVSFHDEPLPRGTAGCILDAAADNDELFVVFNANVVVQPDIGSMIEAHRKDGADMTIMFNPSSNGEPFSSELAQVYICGRSVLEHIPPEGYFDVKEGLVPELIGKGKTIRAMEMPADIGNFWSWHQYIRAVGGFLTKAGSRQGGFEGYRRLAAKDVWVGDDAKIHPGARIFGPVIIGQRADIAEDAVIFGPTMIGKGVAIGKGALVQSSVLWDDSGIGENCEVSGCLVDRHANLPNGTVAEGRAVVCDQGGAIQNAVGHIRSLVSKKTDRLRIQAGRMPQISNKMTPDLPGLAVSSGFVLRGVAIISVVTLLLWSYWPTIVDLWGVWQRSDEYSCGLLVPFLALYVIWSRRHSLAELDIKPTMWGLLAFAAAQALRGVGVVLWLGSAERLSFVLSIASLVLLLFGWQVFRKTSSILLFLCLMLPLPNSVHAAVMLPLQDSATSSAVFCLEMLGYSVVREGNIIHLGDTTVAVAEACNGLRMVTAFFVIIGWMVLLVQRLWWEKLIALISGLPIAMLCNTIRLTVTAIAFTMLSAEKWEGVFHDFGGYAMMPLALAIVVLEFWLITKLGTVPQRQPQEVIVSKKSD